MERQSIHKELDSHSYKHVHDENPFKKKDSHSYRNVHNENPFKRNLVISLYVVVSTLGWAASGIFHNPFLLDLGPWVTILSFRLIVTSCALKIDVHPTSHILPIYTGELCVSLGKICPPYALSDKAGKSSKRGLLDLRVWTFGHPT